MHPALQRKLVRYLKSSTNNQYLIATHSTHFLDAVPCSVFHVRQTAGVSKVERASTSSSRVALCADLGYQASDVIQANSVIWVEGPSDRIYLTWWLRAFAPELVEGVHYATMFYGGRLLAHLSGADDSINPDDADKLISLRRLNQWSAIIIDSDKCSSHARVNATKQRVIEEFRIEPGFAWLTKGREIENYIPPEQVHAGVSVVYKKAHKFPGCGQYERIYEYKKKGSQKPVSRVDKVQVAREVVKGTPELKVLDLRTKLKELASFIRAANDLGG